MTILLRARLVAAATLVAAVASACGGGASASSTCENDNLTIPMPRVISKLTVHPSEKARKIVLDEAKTGRTYVCDASVFELRDGPKKDDELRGVFQVMRLTADARPDDPDFRRKLAQQITQTSSSRPPQKIGNLLVWQGRTNQQLIYAWFQQRFLEVLILRENPLAAGQAQGIDAEALLKEALALSPRPAR